MKWVDSTTNQKPPSTIAVILTISLFLSGIVLAIALSPLSNFFLFTGHLPDSDQTVRIFRNMERDSAMILLSSSIGLFCTCCIILYTWFARYFAVFGILIVQVLIREGLFLLSIYLTWTHTTLNQPITTNIVPFLVTQLSAFVVMETAAVLRVGGGNAYNFVALGAILGSFVGICRSIDQRYFYYGGSDPFSNTPQLGIAFAESILDTFFFVGSCTITSAAVSKSRCGGTILWHFGALTLPITLACAFGTYVELTDFIPIISSDVARYFLATSVVALTIGIAYILIRSFRFGNQLEQDDWIHKARVQSIPQTNANTLIIV